MRIESTRIRHFRSIDLLELDFERLTTICGPNSAGKSNVLRAIQYALDPNPAEVYRNLPASRRDNVGQLRLEVSLRLIDCPPPVLQAAAANPGEVVEFRLRATRGGRITTTLNAQAVAPNFLREHLELIYVPPIRDLAAGGMQPFRDLLGSALRRSRTATSLADASERARTVLHQKANGILFGHREFVRNILRADSLVLDTSGISLEGLYDSVSLNVRVNGQTLSLANFGTGHQSALIINLFRQLGQATPGAKVFLFEEPDNHLHPSTVRAIGDDLTVIAQNAQVIATTHSPILLGHLGLRTVRALTSVDGTTRRRTIDLAGMTDAQIRAQLSYYGLRATEPLLSRRVIVCEGPSDVTVLSELARLRFGRTPEQMDVAVISAGGKEGVVRLCGFLRRLGADWRAVLDRDAADSPELPATAAGITPANAQAVEVAIQEVMGVLENGTKRGKRARSALQGVLNELRNGRPQPAIYDGSHVRMLLEGHVPPATHAQIRAALRGGRRGYQGLLAAHAVWIWSGSLEDVLIPNDPAAAIAEQELFRAGILGAPLPLASRVADLRSVLHNRGEEAEALRAVACALEAAGNFRRTQMAAALSYLFAGL